MTTIPAEKFEEWFDEWANLDEYVNERWFINKKIKEYMEANQ